MLSKTGSLYDAIHAHTTNPKQLMSLSSYSSIRMSCVIVIISISRRKFKYASIIQVLYFTVVGGLHLPQSGQEPPRNINGVLRHEPLDILNVR